MDPQWISDPATSGGPHAYNIPSGAAEPTGLWLSDTKHFVDAKIAGYICLHPGCDDFICGNEAHLDEHVKTHFVDTKASPLQLMPGQFAGLAQSEDITAHRSDDSHDFIATGSTNTPSVITESTPIEFQQWVPPSGPKISRPRFTPSDRRFPCSYCSSSFHRNSDCLRHMKKHDEAPGVRFDCLVAECPRKGIKSFGRQDKLKEHVAARHPLSDFNRYINFRASYQFGRYGYSGGKKFQSGARRFMLWQREKHLWQTGHPFVEIPSLLRIEKFCTYWLNCPECGQSLRYNDEAHMRSQHPFLHIPFWLQAKFVWRDAEMDEKEMLEKLNLVPSVPAREQTFPGPAIPSSGFIDEEWQA